MSQKNKANVDPFGDSPEDQNQKQIFFATFSMLAKLTSIDGSVSKDEVQIIDRFMKEVLHLNGDRRKYAIQVFNAARRESHDFEHYARQYAELMQDKPKMREWMLDVLLRVSLVDKEFSNSERHLLDKARSLFKISDERFEEMQSRYRRTGNGDTTTGADPMAAAYQRLQISPEASEEEVVAAYRRLSVEYGPSRIIELGLPDEFIRLAEKLYTEIQDAFKRVKEARQTVS